MVVLFVYLIVLVRRKILSLITIFIHFTSPKNRSTQYVGIIQIHKIGALR